MVGPEFIRVPGAPWVLVSLSTLPQAGEVAIAQAAIHALEHEAVRVLVTLAPDHAAELGELPDHVYLSDYVPHGTVLSKSRLVISHAGHGIVMKALYYGVPMVLVPWVGISLGWRRVPRPWESQLSSGETNVTMPL